LQGEGPAVLLVLGDPALTHPGAGDDPLVGGIHQGHQVLVGEHAAGDAVSGADDGCAVAGAAVHEGYSFSEVPHEPVSPVDAPGRRGTGEATSCRETQVIPVQRIGVTLPLQ